MTDQLAERYCEFADMLREIDPDALQAKIESLTKLRAMVIAIRGIAGVPIVPAEPKPVAVEMPQEKQGPRYAGYWREAIRKAFDDSNSPMSLKHICGVLRRMDLMTNEDRDASVYQALANSRGSFRRNAIRKQLWELVPEKEKAA